jgi:hypothetical protein
MMRSFADVDGNFVEQFQTTGLDSRLWELYLWAYFVEERLSVERPKPAPDFAVSRHGQQVFVEAVTVNPTDGDLRPNPNAPAIQREPDEIAQLLMEKMAIKFGSALYSKLSRSKPYWEIPEVAGHPLVFAVADFHEPQSMTWSSSALLHYLYGITQQPTYDEHGQLVISTLGIDYHEAEGKKIPSGFFSLSGAENVSAVLSSSSGTISKFNRMGRLAGFGAENLMMYRCGNCHDHDPNASVPKQFLHEVAPGKCTETWGEGLSMYHNPNARSPVPQEAFPSIAHHRFTGGQLVSLLPEFHPYGSFTFTFLLPDR